MVEGGGTVRSTVGLEKPRFWSLGALPSSEKLPLLLPYWDEDNDDDREGINDTKGVEYLFPLPSAGDSQAQVEHTDGKSYSCGQFNTCLQC